MFGLCIQNGPIKVLRCSKRREGTVFGCNVLEYRKKTLFGFPKKW